MNLQTRINAGSRNLKMYAKRLEKLDILTMRDLLYHIPFRYEDYSLIVKIGSLQEGERVTIQAPVLKATTTYTRSRKTIQKVTLGDETGSLELTWFNQPFIVKSLVIGDILSVSGKVETFARKLTMIAPDYEIFTGTTLHTGRIVPIYPETHGVSSKWLRRQISLALTELEDQLEDPLPKDIQQKNQFLDLPLALKKIHFPDTIEQSLQAKHRLAFDEVFLLQLAVLQRKKQWKDKGKGPLIKLTLSDLQGFTHSLPFTLTQSQQRAVDDILHNMSQTQPMNRLLQGDVGSGKTVIAAIACFAAYRSGYQSAIMAPTEILAQQHYQTLERLLTPFNISVGLATSGKKLEKDSHFDVYVGTHALVAKSVTFSKLGFVAIDEQQRFGVEQRGILREKGLNPHVLTMTATPIPRTVALTLYGELDVSYLTEMPKGRKPIKTWLVPDTKRDGAYDWIRQEIQKTSSQVFIICPFIEESENMQTVKAAAKEYERLRVDVYPDLRLGLLHGRLKMKEKDEVLTAFREKQFDILVATPVVEVGIDIPNATVMVVEGSERFGLAQLHQLRGRVGRGDKQSYCLLFTDTTQERGITRLKAMETMSQGAALAEFDLKMRGPGDMYGVAQSGVKLLKIASFSDIELLDLAKKTAEQIFPDLAGYALLAEQVNDRLSKKVTPD